MAEATPHVRGSGLGHFLLAAVSGKAHLFFREEHRRRGPVVMIRLYPTRESSYMVSVAEPKLLEALHFNRLPGVLTDRIRDLSCKVTDDGYHEQRRFYPESTVLLPSGKAHQQHRQFLKNALSQGLSTLAVIASRRTHRLVSTWTKRKTSRQVDVWPGIKSGMLAVILESLLAARPADRQLHKLGAALDLYLLASNAGMAFPPSSRAYAGLLYWPRRKLARHLMSFLYAADTATTTWARDLIAGGWSQDEILDELIESIAAGHDAPANLLAAVLYELARNPDIQEQLHDALRKAGLAAGQPAVALSALRGIPLLRAIIDETHRLHPAVELLPRFAGADCRIASVEVPQGTVIWGNYFAANTDTRWHDPLRWNPLRFMDDARPVPKILRPFGAGSRGCPGMSFSEAEAMVMCSQMVLAARFSACRETKWETRHYATTGPKHGLMLTVSPRPG